MGTAQYYETDRRRVRPTSRRYLSLGRICFLALVFLKSHRQAGRSISFNIGLEDAKGRTRRVTIGQHGRIDAHRGPH